MKLKFAFTLVLVCLLSNSSIFSQDKSGEVSWPREIKTKKAFVVVYQPQVETLTDIRLDARAAVAVTPKGTEKPLFGAAWFTSRINTDRDTRMTSMSDLKVSSIKFPDGTDQQKEELKGLLEREMQKWTISLSLDRLITSLNYNPDTDNKEQFNTQPPEIIYADEPSILVVLDGDPIYKDLSDAPGYLEVINTPFLLMSDVMKKNFFLYGNGTWYKAGALSDKWEPTSDVPYVLEALGRKAEKEKKKEAEEEPLVTGPVKVFLRTHPAELIQSKGKPDFSPVEDTHLLYLTNSEDDILMDIETQQYYVLLSGRWYKTANLTSNSWHYVPQNELPSEFASIPADSDLGSVRTNIAGTPEAHEAILDNTIPQTAEIDRRQATVEVSYDGTPEFDRIKGTSMEYAVNTDQSVLKINNQYYCCSDAVWFVANGPYGPWSVCVDVPETVQDIPPEYPVYNVKYVHVYHYTPQVVYVGYTPGYLGSYVYNGSIIYGTGYYYHPWYRHYYYPRPVTYGFGVHYSPWSGWGFSYGVSVGWFHVGIGYHTAAYYRRGWWGPGGYAPGYRYGYGMGFHYGYSRGWAAGARAATWQSNRRSYYSARNENIYRSRTTGVKSTGSNPRRGTTTNRNVVDANKQVRRSSETVPRQNNVYTDHNGDVYRHTNNGWQKRENGQWHDSGKPGNRPTEPGNAGNRRTIPSSGNRASTNSGGRASTSNQSDRSRTNPGSQHRTSQTGNTNNRSNTGNFNRNYNKPPTGTLQHDYNSRNRGTQRTTNYHKTTKPSKPKGRTAPKTRSSSGKKPPVKTTGRRR